VTLIIGLREEKGNFSIPRIEKERFKRPLAFLRCCPPKEIIISDG
jgi:hypothetical protein